MTSRATNNSPPLPSPSRLKLGLFNAENLFLLFDHEIPPHYQKMNEAQWQKLSSSVYENKSLDKCLQIAQLIKEQSPDIMMLCEVGGLESLQNFNKLFLEQLYQPVLIEGNSDRNIDVGFLIKKQSPFFFDINSNRHYPLELVYPHESQSLQSGYSSAVSHLFSRDCVELRLFTNDRENPYLLILLTHLKSRLDPEKIDPGGTEKRGAELKAVVNIYKNIRQQWPEVPVILAGDMNGYAGEPNPDPEFSLLYNETDLKDVLEVSQINSERRFTFYQIKSGGRSEGKQIDYCFLSPELHSCVRHAETAVYQYKDEFGFDIDRPKTMEEKLRLPSDHYPIFFTLENLKV
ncbi:endonuclease/exonuclease/phosphatase family protein [Pseudobdellovibrio exovorus]|uniref:Endonuclease/exonuclease/phosphatase domain-containing protein n=1 Tax=Pseudobdellovibrio exovorus JSS TaxID=1184267 RepID=M4V6Z7_9BACT|nr:hypothetical protein [Pseudobdellovibrio exovorus]AGH95157.1 hypothetical protein A11Q_941 [Pseudobdellovibrio exovorus JSS]